MENKCPAIAQQPCFRFAPIPGFIRGRTWTVHEEELCEAISGRCCDLIFDSTTSLESLEKEWENEEIKGKILRVCGNTSDGDGLNWSRKRKRKGALDR